MKHCPTCNLSKLPCEFSKSCLRPDGLQSSCKDCRRAYHMKRAYDLSLADYDRMVEAQEGRCAICGTSEPGGRFGRFCVDHDHETGAVRSLLCISCNRDMRIFDNPDALNSFLRYKQKHSGDRSCAPFTFIA